MYLGNEWLEKSVGLNTWLRIETKIDILLKELGVAPEQIYEECRKRQALLSESTSAQAVPPPETVRQQEAATQSPAVAEPQQPSPRRNLRVVQRNEAARIAARNATMASRRRDKVRKIAAVLISHAEIEGLPMDKPLFGLTLSQVARVLNNSGLTTMRGRPGNWCAATLRGWRPEVEGALRSCVNQMQQAA